MLALLISLLVLGSNIFPRQMRHQTRQTKSLRHSSRSPWRGLQPQINVRSHFLFHDPPRLPSPSPKQLLWPAPRASCFAAQRFDIQRLSRPPLCCSHLYLPPSSASTTPSGERKRTLWLGLTYKFTWQTHSSVYWICMYECVFAYINVSHKWAVPAIPRTPKLYEIICTDSFSIKANY